MTGRPQSYATGLTLALVSATLWSGMALGLRMIEAASVWEILFWRSIGLLPVVAGLILWTHGGLVAPVRGAGKAGVIGGIGIAISFCGAVYAIQSTTVANAVFLFSASPFLAALFSGLVLGERVRRSTWFAIALALVGVFIMVRDGLAFGAGPGNVAALISAAGFATMILAMRARPEAEPAVPVLLGAVFNLAIALPAALALGGRFWIGLHDAGVAVGLGTGILGLGLALYSRAARSLPAAELALVSMVEVVLAPIWVWLVLGEKTREGTLMGGAILLAALLFNALAATRAPPSPSTAAGG